MKKPLSLYGSQYHPSNPSNRPSNPEEMLRVGRDYFLVNGPARRNRNAFPTAPAVPVRPQQTRTVYIGAHTHRRRHKQQHLAAPLGDIDGVGEGEGDGENGFRTLPREIQYQIFAKLDCHDLARARSVCKEWSHLLSRSSLQALTSLPGTSTDPIFILKIFYATGNRRSQVQQDGEPVTTIEVVEAFVSVDHHGRCGAFDMLANVHHVCHEWDVSCNGLLPCFPDKFRNDGVNDKVVVCHPSLNWLERVSVNVSSPSAPIVRQYSREDGLRGLWYDPSTSHFTLLIVFNKSKCSLSYEVHIYSSKTKQWTILERELVNDDAFEVREIGLFMNGCFFWIDQGRDPSAEKRVLIFDLSEELFHRKALPECPLHSQDRRGKFCYNGEPAGSKWALKGCDGNLVLVHHSRSSGQPCGVNDIVCWKLEQVAAATLTWNLVFHLSQVTMSPNHRKFAIDKSGWWLFAKDSDRERQTDLIMLDDKGNVQHYIPMTTLAPFLNISTEGASVAVANILPLEKNNLWNVLALS